MNIQPMKPSVEEIVGKGYSHYAFACYFAKRVDGEISEEPDGPVAEGVLELITAFADKVDGKVCSLPPSKSAHEVVGAAWSKRHVWVGFNL